METPKGNKSQNAMDLIMKLENTVREAREERNHFKMLYYAVLTYKSASFWTGVVIGCLMFFIIGILVWLKII